ncbi:hypothetical protein BpHYR1_043324 [Brachionus plicatilis]|uniref:Uncharacterized protein n=1 Tax=Brachionus plicatilis TaxID=10195 RepID=A0A3M7QI41_BRAPC|nr:hypothetical protein BpHYR1_043324 [Brachionus plicatilis]
MKHEIKEKAKNCLNFFIYYKIIHGWFLSIKKKYQRIEEALAIRLPILAILFNCFVNLKLALIQNFKNPFEAILFVRFKKQTKD